MKKYEIPEMKMSAFSIEHVITTSGAISSELESWKNENDGSQTVTLDYLTILDVNVVL